MRFDFTSEELEFRWELTSLLKREVPPDWEGWFEVETDEEWEEVLKLRRKLAEKGWLTPAWPVEYGGRGASFMQQVIYTEEMAYNRASGAMDIWGVQMLAPTLMIHGTEEQKRRFLPPIARAETQWCQGYSEPETGSDLASLQLRAVEEGDDFVLNGAKIWTSNAHRADWIFVMARTDPSAPKHRGISFLLCDTRQKGVTVQPIANMTGLHTFNMVVFDDARVPRENLVGEKNRGWYVAAALLDFERSGIQYAGAGRRTLEELVEFARETRYDGQPLARRPMVRYRLADMAIEIDVSRLLSYHIGWLQGQGAVPNKEAAMGKLFGTELQQHVARAGVQIMGLYGQLEPDSKYAPLQGRIERSYMTTVASTIAGGTSEIMRNILATRGLGLPRG